MINILKYFDIFNKESLLLMSSENEIPVLPGDRIMVLAAKGDMRYYFGIVKELCIENAYGHYTRQIKINPVRGA